MQKNLDSQIVDHEKIAKELEIQNDSLDKEIASLLDHCKVTEQQLTTYVSSPEYFTESQWETLQTERKKMDEALLLKLACIQNPAKKKKRQEERIVAPHWLFVR